MANFLATRLPGLAAAAPFYGSPPPLEDVPEIKAELLVVLAANEERVNAAWPGYEAALEAADVQYTLDKPAGTRSEEHTSELQALMRISQAVFCLKKNTRKQLH